MPVSNYNVQVTYHGPLFQGRAGEIARRTAKDAALDKVVERWMRKGRRLGRRNNTLTAHDRQALTAEISSTLRWPRRSGKSWQKNQLRIARAMLPRVLKATEKRLAQELGG